MNALVLGAGGFIGSHLVKDLKKRGYWVRGVDLKQPEFSTTHADEFLLLDLRIPENVNAVLRLNRERVYSFLPKPFEELESFDEVYQLAADMGGAGYIFSGENDADVMHNSSLININVAHYAVQKEVKKLFFSSSACIYPQEIQNEYFNRGLSESDAYPANPDSPYGWEKLFSENLYEAYKRNYGLNIRIARFHNIFGPEGTYEGGKEKAPAAICRKVSEADNQIEVWGTGEQTRSFLYIDECIEGIRRLMESEYQEPVNIGSDELISINNLAEMIIKISGKNLTIKNIEGQTGVMGRNSDNTLINNVLGWSPKQPLKEGIIKTYKWINELITK